jgi:biotin carboxylase
MSDLADRLGILMPRRILVDSISDALQAIGLVGLPAICKPADNSGSRGVSLLSTDRDLDRSFAYARANTLAGLVVVEQFIEGLEFGAQYLSDPTQGADLVFMHNDQLLAEGLGPAGHSMPFIGEVPDERVLEIARRIASDLSHTGPLNLDMVASPEGLFLLEVAGRFGGGCLPRLIRMASGVSIEDTLLSMALGEAALSGTPLIVRPAAATYVKSPRAGVLKGVVLPADVDERVEVSVYKAPGDSVREFHSATDAVATVYARGGTVEQAEYLAHSTASRLAVMTKEMDGRGDA